jgi:hypothetical protein
MTPEMQRVAIAEACGWRAHRFYDGLGWLPKDREPHQGGLTLPDFLNDLNAMHEAEKTLSDGQWLIYEHALQSITAQHGDYSHCILIHSTASQRAEAFLKAKELWK